MMNWAMARRLLAFCQQACKAIFYCEVLVPVWKRNSDEAYWSYACCFGPSAISIPSYYIGSPWRYTGPNWAESLGYHFQQVPIAKNLSDAQRLTSPHIDVAVAKGRLPCTAPPPFRASCIRGPAVKQGTRDQVSDHQQSCVSCDGCFQRGPVVCPGEHSGCCAWPDPCMSCLLCGITRGTYSSSQLFFSCLPASIWNHGHLPGRCGVAT